MARSVSLCCSIGGWKVFEMHKFRDSSFAYLQSGSAEKSLFRHTIVGNVGPFPAIGSRFRLNRQAGPGLMAREADSAWTPLSQTGNIAQLPRRGLEKRLHAGP